MSGADEEVELVFTKARMEHLRTKSPESMRHIAGIAERPPVQGRDNHPVIFQ
jgi:hypothetical protein